MFQLPKTVAYKPQLQRNNGKIFVLQHLSAVLIVVEHTGQTQEKVPYGDRPAIISSFLVISIVIDSDRGHCCKHFKKKYLFMMKIECVTFI